MTIVDKPASKRQTKGVARHPEFEAELGARIRGLRVAAGMSQAAVGGALGFSFQPVQKYEVGKDRVAMATLSTLASVLGVGLDAFFSDEASLTPCSKTEILEARRIGTRVLSMKDPKLIQHVIHLVDTLAEAVRLVRVVNCEDPETVN